MKNIIFIITLIFIQFTFAIAPPTGSTNQYFCNSNFWTLEDLIVNSSTGQVFWFGENDNSGVQLSVNTVLTNGVTYFAFESTNSGEVSLAITTHLLNEIPAPESIIEDSCNIGNITLADLSVFNTDGFSTIYWFSDNNSSGNILPSSTTVFDGSTYYAFQGLGDCAISTAVTVFFSNLIIAPIGEQEQTLCIGDNPVLQDLQIFNTEGFSSIIFFEDQNQITALSPTTPLVDGTTYYAFQGIGTCTEFLPITISLVNCIPNPQIIWQNTIGGERYEFLRELTPTNDGGYILGGHSNSDISDDKSENAFEGGRDFWIVKVNAIGEIEWDNTIGGNSSEYFITIKQTSDGGYILSGDSSSGISGDKTEENFGGDYWIIKLNTIGEIEWQNTIGGESFDFFPYVSETLDGGFIVGGTSNSAISGDKTEDAIGDSDYWILKLNTLGQIEWQNTIGGIQEEQLWLIFQTNDGGYIMGGYSNSAISGDKTEDAIGDFDYWIVKVDTNGNIEWDNTIGANGFNTLRDLIQTNDGGYLVGGDSSSDIFGDKTENSNGASDYWVLKLNALGEIEWQNTIGGSGGELLQSIKQTNDGGYILGGSSDSNISGDKTQNSKGLSDYWIVKLNNNGLIEWDNTIGGSENDRLRSISQLNNNEYIVAGYSNSTISEDKTEINLGDYDYWIMKLTQTPLSIIEETINAKLVIFPNPTFNYFNITASIEIEIIELYTINGKRIKKFEYPQSTYLISDLKKGIYIIKIVTKKDIYYEKLIKK